jgi:glycine/D-amino acid oxidase-like deaminating enzyme
MAKMIGLNSPDAPSIWAATAPALAPVPPLDGDVDVDVAIVGAGYCGLSAAIHLRDAGVDVAVLDAHQPGWGASGRNGGQVIPGFKHNPMELEALHGRERGRALAQVGHDAPALVYALVERFGIECGLARAGWISAAHTLKAADAWRRRVEGEQRLGLPTRYLDAADVSARLGTDAYVGGLFDPRGGGVQPLAYARGLAKAAVSLGARLYEARVEGVELARDGWTLRTPRGRVRARRVGLATNGYTGRLHPALATRLVPVQSYQMATAPLSDNLRRVIMAGGLTASDTRPLLRYFRLSPDGRFVMGGRGSFSLADRPALYEAVAKAARELYPALADLPFEHAWAGQIALTRDHMPRLMTLAPGLAFAGGFNGRGVAMATMFGRLLADWARGEDLSHLPVATDPLGAYPFHGLRLPVMNAYAFWLSLKERWGG